VRLQMALDEPHNSCKLADIMPGASEFFKFPPAPRRERRQHLRAGVSQSVSAVRP
jgi:hypothetical protein